MTRTRSGLAPGGRAKLAAVAVAVGAMAAALLTPGAASAAVDPRPGRSCPSPSTTAVTVPNTCRADTDLPYMTWDQILQLQNTLTTTRR